MCNKYVDEESHVKYYGCHLLDVYDALIASRFKLMLQHDIPSTSIQLGLRVEHVHSSVQPVKTTCSGVVELNWDQWGWQFESIHATVTTSLSCLKAHVAAAAAATARPVAQTKPADEQEERYLNYYYYSCDVLGCVATAGQSVRYHALPRRNRCSHRNRSSGQAATSLRADST